MTSSNVMLAVVVVTPTSPPPVALKIPTGFPAPSPTKNASSSFVEIRLAFGDFSYYWIADREGRSFKRLNELYATTGQVGFLASQRVDGKLILPEAVKLLSMKSA